MPHNLLSMCLNGILSGDAFKLYLKPIKNFYLFILLLVFCGCASSPKPAVKEQMQLDIRISAMPELNPDEKKRPSPLLLRVYELKFDSAFASADYFSLQEKDKVVLGDELLARDEYIIRPGEKIAIQRKSNPETTVIGVFAGYRDPASSIWRRAIKLNEAPEMSWYRTFLPAKKIRLDISLGENAINVTELD